MEKTFHETVRGNVCDDDAEQGWESTEVHGLQVNGGSSSEQTLAGMSRGSTVKRGRASAPGAQIVTLLHRIIFSNYRVS